MSSIFLNLINEIHLKHSELLNFHQKLSKTEDFREIVTSLSVIVEEENNRNNESIVNKLRHSCFVHVF